jgi:hypothetical protein
VRHHPALQRQRAETREDEPQQVGDRKHDLGAQRAAEQQAQRREARGAERDDRCPEDKPEDARPPAQGKADGAQQN